MGGREITHKMVDTLVHLDDERVSPGALDGIFSRAAEAGVTRVLNGGTNPFALDDERLQTLVRTGEKHGVDVRFAFGLHPQFIAAAGSPSPEAVQDRLQAVVKRWGDRVVAVGEIGLDHRTRDRDVDEDFQRTHFLVQLAFARERGLPVIIHAVKAWGALVDTLDAHLETNEGDGVKGVVHGFTGSIESMRELMARGLTIGIGRAVLWDNAKRLHAALSSSDDVLKALVLETDAPDHAPEGQAISEPKDLGEVAHAVAQWTGQAIEDVQAVTTETAEHVYGWTAAAVDD